MIGRLKSWGWHITTAVLIFSVLLFALYYHPDRVRAAGTNLTTGYDNDGGTGSVSASISPAANNLILLTVVQRTGISTDPNVPTVTGNGLTWVQVNTVVWDTTSSSRKRISVFRAMGAAPSTGAVTIDFGGQANTDVLWTIDQISGTDTSGTNGSGAIVQSVTAIDETGTLSTFTATLAAFGSAANGTFGGFALDTQNTPIAGTGFTLLGTKTDGAALSLGTASEYTTANDTTVDLDNNAQTSSWGAIAVEVKAAAAAPSGGGGVTPNFINEDD